MAEYLSKVVLPAAGVAEVAVPVNGAVLGIYSTSAIQIEWLFNGDAAQLFASVTEWEPHTPFRPRAASSIRMTAAAAATIAVRMCDNGA